MLAASGMSSAQIYSSAAADGAVVLSNFRSDATPSLLIADPDPPGIAQAPTVRSPAAAHSTLLRLPAAPSELQLLIKEVAAQVQIAPELLHAVIAAESRYDSRALSPRGAIGLMQLLPATALRFGAKDPYIARQNVLAGASYLKWLMAFFQNDLELVLAAYNAGEQAVLKAGGRIPPYPETQAYVPRVLGYLRCAQSPACKAG
jgi:soluble lytic murein transglycosylase-like protein